MTKSIISPEEGDELKRLYKEHAKASEQAAVILAARGMDSREFFEADKATGALWRRIREILGVSSSHWMA